MPFSCDHHNQPFARPLDVDYIWLCGKYARAPENIFERENLRCRPRTRTPPASRIHPDQQRSNNIARQTTDVALTSDKAPALAYLATPDVGRHYNCVHGLHIQLLITHKHRRLDSREGGLRRVEPESYARHLWEAPFVRGNTGHASLERRDQCPSRNKLRYDGVGVWEHGEQILHEDGGA